MTVHTCAISLPIKAAQDPCIPLVAAARVFRLAGALDSAECQLNAAAGVFRSLNLKNTSRAYRAESRQLMYARLAANERAELASALANKTAFSEPEDDDWSN